MYPQTSKCLCDLVESALLKILGGPLFTQSYALDRGVARQKVVSRRQAERWLEDFHERKTLNQLLIDLD